VISTHLLETEDRIAQFSGDASKPDMSYVFWIYSLGIYRHVLAMLGFDIARTVTGQFRYNTLNGSFLRTAIVAIGTQR